jgi:hypothetical protein
VVQVPRHVRAHDDVGREGAVQEVVAELLEQAAHRRLHRAQVRERLRREVEVRERAPRLGVGRVKED